MPGFAGTTRAVFGSVIPTAGGGGYRLETLGELQPQLIPQRCNQSVFAAVLAS